MKIRIAISALTLLVSLSSAQTRPNFSGTYTRSVQKFHAHAKTVTATLKIIQTDKFVELTYREGGKARTRKLMLDGSETNEATPIGVMKEKVSFRGQTLVISSAVPGSDPGSDIGASGSEEDVWELSPDKKKLTVRSSLKSQDKVVHEDTRVYKRVHNSKAKNPAK
jgi:hypothetical protein